METLIVFVLAELAVIALALWLRPRVIARWDRKRDLLAGVRMVECAHCFEELPVAWAVIVTKAQAAEDGPGGTATVAEYHAECAKLAGVKSDHP